MMAPITGRILLQANMRLYLLYFNLNCLLNCVPMLFSNNLSVEESIHFLQISGSIIEFTTAMGLTAHKATNEGNYL